MNVGSLFSGIGGLDLGLERAGHRVVWQCESDPWRRGVLAAHWPDVPCYEDVAALDFSARAGGLGAGDGAVGAGHGVGSADWGGHELPGEGVDLLCGGFPCQDVSVAGRRAGLAGARSGLFHEFARIAGELRPAWILLENVPGLLSSHHGRDFATVIDTLDRLGYVGAWRVLDSRFFGVPQRRRRVFILAARADIDPGAVRCSEILAVGARCRRHSQAGGGAGPGVADALAGGAGSRGHRVGADEAGRRSEDDPNLVTQEGVRRLTPRECERLQSLPDDWTLVEWRGKPAPDGRRYAALGDAVTSNVGEWIGRRLEAVGR